MKKEEIAKFAYLVTYTNNRTEIVFKNGNKVTGFFEGNTLHSKMYNENKWTFVVFPPDAERSQTTFNGDDFSSITLYQF